MNATLATTAAFPMCNSDSALVQADSAISTSVDLPESSMRVVIDPTCILAMIGTKIIDGKYTDLLCWQMGVEYKVAPMLTIGTNILLSTQSQHIYTKEFVFPTGMVERYVSSRTFQYVRARLSLDWYLSGRAYSDSFVFGLEGNVRTVSERSALSTSPLSIGASTGHRWFWQNGFTAEITFGVDTYKGDESAKSLYSRVMIGYVF